MMNNTASGVYNKQMVIVFVCAKKVSAGDGSGFTAEHTVKAENQKNEEDKNFHELDTISGDQAGTEFFRDTDSFRSEDDFEADVLFGEKVLKQLKRFYVRVPFPKVIKMLEEKINMNFVRVAIKVFKTKKTIKLLKINRIVLDWKSC